MDSIITRKAKEGSPRYTAFIRIKQEGVIIHTESHSFPKKSLANDGI